jgi:enediyne biosynthesis protein E4
LDIGVTNFSEESYALFRNDGGGLFTDKASAVGIAKPSTAYLGWGMFFGDFDNDGWNDLFAANGHVYPQVDSVEIGTKYKQRPLLFRNLGNGNFANAAAEADIGLSQPRAYRGAALGDTDNDGDLDILMMDLDGQPVLLENRSSHSGNFLRVRAPIGSTVTLEAAGMKQLDEVRASGSYQSASEPVAHFGLANRTVADRVTVKISGTKSKTFTNVKANQVLTAGAK